MEKTLHAFYDSAVSPTCYDFMQFLQLTECHRLRYGFADFILYFVPGPKQGFRDDDLPSPVAEREMMFRNILLPAGHLYKACKSIIWMKDRIQVNFDEIFNTTMVFPMGYTLTNPRSQYITQAINEVVVRGEHLNDFQPPEDYLLMIEELIKYRAEGRKIITINLRENLDYPSKNSDIKSWDKFCKEIDKNEYFPILIRETCFAHQPCGYFKNIYRSELAAVNLLYRAALYHLAYINMFVNNGPAMCSIYSPSRTMVFKVISPEDIATSEQWYIDIFGMRKNDQNPSYKKSTIHYWVEDNYFNLKAGFEEMVDMIESNPTNLNARWGCKDDEQLYLYLLTIIRHIISEFRYGVHIENLKTLDIIKSKYNIKFDLKQIIKTNFGQNSDAIINLLKMNSIVNNLHVI